METWDVGLCLPGCPSLTGPSSVSGTTGGSVSMQCQYEDVYKGYNKYWCGQYDTACDVIVETKGKEKEERNGCVTIRDHADNLTLMVTMENLNADDAGSYWCRIQTVWILGALSSDPSVQVKVSVSLLSGIHFLLLVFLKVPLFLSILSAVLWVNRPQRDPGGNRVSLSRRNHRSPSPGMPCPGIQPFRPDEKDLRTPGPRAGGEVTGL
ncbi:LOW QUALITY PROTEIN: CMRF35-like molecule 2 [Dugong dugon]